MLTKSKNQDDRELKRYAPSRRRSRSRHPRDRFKQLKDGPGYRVRDARLAWGTKVTTSRVQEVMFSYSLRFPEAAPVDIGHLSKRYGGVLKPHKSHRTGRDVDIKIITKRDSDYSVEATPRTIDVERNWYLIKNFIDTGDVVHIFLDLRLQRRIYKYALKEGVPKEELKRIFQYPARSAKAIVRHEPGHKNHFHIRFIRDNKRLKKDLPSI